MQIDEHLHHDTSGKHMAPSSDGSRAVKALLLVLSAGVNFSKQNLLRRCTY